MRVSHVVAIVVTTAGVAGAEPIAIARVGGAYVSDRIPSTSSASGYALDLDFQLGWRLRPWLAASAYAGYRQVTGEAVHDPILPVAYSNAATVYTIGGRLLYAPISRLQVELGIGYSNDQRIDINRGLDRGNVGGLAMELGVTVPIVRLGPATLVVSAVVGHSEYDEDGEASFGTLAVGAQIAPFATRDACFLSEEPAPFDVAVRGGFYTRAGEATTIGGRLELEAGLQPIRWASLAAVVAFSEYRRHDTDVTVSVPELRVGARLLAHPHWRVFAGALVGSRWRHDAQLRRQATDFEPIAGVNLAHVEGYLIHVAATFESDRFGTSYALMVGAQCPSNRCM